MSKLRHIAVIVEDPEASAKFFEEAFDMSLRRHGAARHLYVGRHLQRRTAEEGRRREARALSTSACGSTISIRPRRAVVRCRRRSISPGAWHLAELVLRGRSTRPRPGSCSTSPTPAGAGAVKDVVPAEIRGYGEARSDRRGRRRPGGPVPRARAGATGSFVVLVESMTDENFLDQVPRAGSNHPTTLEFFDRIGSYEKMEPRGLIAPKFHYWDRQDNALIAEFDHALLKDDTKFPFVLQCERIKIIEEALKLAKAHPLVDVADGDGILGLHAERRRGSGAGEERRRRNRDDPRQLLRQRRGRAQHRPQGAEPRIRRLHLSGRTIDSRSPTISAGTATERTISDSVEYSNLLPLESARPDRWRIHFPTASSTTTRTS